MPARPVPRPAELGEVVRIPLPRLPGGSAESAVQRLRNSSALALCPRSESTLGEVRRTERPLGCDPERRELAIASRPERRERVRSPLRRAITPREIGQSVLRSRAPITRSPRRLHPQNGVYTPLPVLLWTRPLASSQAGPAGVCAATAERSVRWTGDLVAVARLIS